MADKPALHIVFTLNCDPVAGPSFREGPKTWELSARAIEGFCARLDHAGYVPSLFVAPRAIEEHAPLLEELHDRGIELGILLHPPTVGDGQYRNLLGTYDAVYQSELIELALEQAEAEIGFRPHSFRSRNFSANDETFRVLTGHGFRRGSVSNPGRHLPKEGAVWTGAVPDPHFAHATNRLQAGTLPFFEMPVTADIGERIRRGLQPDLCSEGGFFQQWIQPIIDNQLQRQADANVPFRSLCVYSHTAFPYFNDNDRNTVTLDLLLLYFDSLRETYDVIPTNLADAQERFRKLSTES